jgi:DNA-binding MarR family transcriptional regulator
MVSPYLKLMNLIASITDENNLDAISLRLLEAIALAVENGQPLSVTNAMQLGHIASQATIHRKIDALVKNGFVVHQAESDAKRTKLLTLSNKSVQLIQQLNGCLIRANS